VAGVQKCSSFFVHGLTSQKNNIGVLSGEYVVVVVVLLGLFI